jgi:hypothetical protein
VRFLLVYDRYPVVSDHKAPPNTDTSASIDPSIPQHRSTRFINDAEAW